MRVLVADDEELARRRLRQLLARHTEVAVVAECADGRVACDLIADIRPELVFLDVDMPERNGLEVVAAVGLAQMPATVFATAYDHFAVAAFDANAVDYLLKPFDQERLDRALARVRRFGRAGQAASVGAALDTLQTRQRWGEHILLPCGASQQMVALADVQCIAAEGNYVRLHADGASWLLRGSLSAVLDKLDPQRFRRIHRSHIVNIAHVAKVLPWLGGDALVMMRDGRRWRMSRNFRHALAEEDI